MELRDYCNAWVVVVSITRYIRILNREILQSGENNDKGQRSCGVNIMGNTGVK